jgi:parallel beta-helix repeat protein
VERVHAKLKMKTAILLSLLLATTIAALSTIRPSLSNPTTLLVPSQYSTIQAALFAASSGDTIIVSSGVYNETNLVITQNGLTLQGQDKTNTIIDGQNSNKNITVVKANNAMIRGFTIRKAGTEYGAFGVYVYSSNNTVLKDIVFSNCTFSVRAEKSFNVTVASSSFFGDSGNMASAGVYALNSQTGLVVNGTFNANHVGVFLRNSTGFTVRNNNFSSSIYLGVDVAYSTQNLVVKNTFKNNNSSIVIKYYGDNEVIGNSISDSQTAGLIMSSQPNSTNNVIHHNNFINNAQQVKFVSSPLANIWDLASGQIAEGNYWSDYKSTDFDRNGIGDTVYTIATGNQDSYPLTGPFTEFTVTSQTGTYNVYTISNSTITDFSFDKTAKHFSFSVSDASGTLGVCRIVFPWALLSQPYTVYMNGISQFPSPIYNSTHAALYFSYTHSSQPSNVIIVPEFPAVLIVAFLLILTYLAAILKKKTGDSATKLLLI